MSKSENGQVNDNEGFCQMLMSSRLVDQEELTQILADFSAHAHGSRLGRSLTGFTQYLIARQIITAWQCAKLRNRQYKGFRLDGFIILDVEGYRADHTRFLAQDTCFSRLIVLCVRPHDSWREKGEPEYWQEDFEP